MIGVLARIFFLALETLAAAAAQMLGFANPFGIQIEAGEMLPPLATLISLAALTLVFVADLHWELLRRPRRVLRRRAGRRRLRRPLRAEAGRRRPRRIVPPRR